MIEILRSLSQLGKKVLLVLFFFCLILLIIPMFFQPSHQLSQVSDTTEQDRKEMYRLVYSQKKTDMEKYVFAQYSKLALCKLIGELCSANPNEAKNYYADSNLNYATNLISAPLTNPPASGAYWAFDSLQKSGFIPKTYAAEGIGFAGIRPLTEIWVIFRNTTFLLLSLFMMVIGLLIMIRFKINPQTIITVENALPRIFLTLLFITFSFPIAGFLIDVMYIVILIGVTIMAQATAKINPNVAIDVFHLQKTFTAGTLGTIWDNLFPEIQNKSFFNAIPFLGRFVSLSNLGNALVGVLPSAVGDIFRVISTFFVTASVVGFFSDDKKFGIFTHIGDFFNNWSVLAESAGRSIGNVMIVVFKTLTFIILGTFLFIYGAGFILAIAIFFTILFLLIRLFVLMFASYLKILLLIIFAPILILPTVLPGKNGFTHWFRLIVAEIATFPIIVFILMTGRLLVVVFANSGGINGQFGSSDTYLWHPPFLSSIGRKNLAILIGMTLIFILPDIVRYTKQKISGSKGLPFKFGPGVFFGGLGAAGGGAVGALGKFGHLSLGLSHVVGGENTKKIQEGITGGIKKVFGIGGGGGH